MHSSRENSIAPLYFRVREGERERESQEDYEKRNRICRDTRRIAGQGGQLERKGTEDHIQQIFIILFPNHVLLILLRTGFVLIRE